jgi:adenosylcobinamide-phosphate synthase
LNRTKLLCAAYLLDQALGDPEWLPHPVRLIGLATTHGENALRRPEQTKAGELVSGAVLTFTIVATTYFLTAKTLREAHRISEPLGNTVEALLGWTCLAACSLQQEATSVINALEAGEMVLARTRLARIVGRDTQHLDEQEISRAVIETVAESASDGIIAPLFYMTIGGVPLAMAYKAVNTLDSMIGHADERHFYFGKVAARLDDAANYLPSRSTALAVVAASNLLPEGDPHAAWQTWRRDGAKHKSPNAGQPESAVAGALQVQLGGDNTYAGKPVRGPRMGQEFPAANLFQAKRAIRLVGIVSLLGLATGVLLSPAIWRRTSQ